MADVSESMECLCYLMKTVGPRLDIPKAKVCKQVYQILCTLWKICAWDVCGPLCDEPVPRPKPVPMPDNPWSPAISPDSNVGKKITIQKRLLPHEMLK